MPWLRLLLPILALALAGCLPEGLPSGGVDERAGGDLNPDAEWWIPQPANVRIFPGTRFIAGDDEQHPVLEARLELLDQMGDPVKATGSLRFELFAGEGTTNARAGQQLYTWHAALQTLPDQRDHYDPVIHGYVFRLGADQPDAADRPTVLRVTYQPRDGQRLTTQAPVRNDW